MRKFTRSFLGGILLSAITISNASAQCGNIGIYYWGGSLKTADSNTIIPTAKKLADSLHVNTIRFTLACNDDEVYRGTSHCLTGMNLTQLAQRADFNSIITDPQFTTVIITAYDWASFGDCATTNFLDTAFYTPTNTAAIETEFTNLATYLSSFPTKKFIITNWEADNQCYCGAAYYYPNCASAPENIAGFTKWMNARAAGINAAHVSNVKVGIEFCNIHSLEAAGKPDILDTVIPYVYSDYFLYSSYESINVSPQQTASDIVFIRKKLARFGKDSNNLLMGEMGFPSIAYPHDTAAGKLAKIIHVLDKFNIPTAIVWALIDSPTDFGAYDSNGIITLNGDTVKATTCSCHLTASVSINSNVSCNGNSDGNAHVVVGSGNSPYTYFWSNGVTDVSTSSPTGAILSAGTYTVTVQDAHSCVATASVTITQPNTLTASMGAPTDPLCNGGTGSSTVTAGGGTTPYTYSWAPSGGAGATGTGLTAGSFTVTVKDKNGCSATASVTITQASALTASMGAPTNILCNGGTSSATVIAGGGTTPYTYSWAPSGGVGATGTGLTAGTFTVTVKDNHGCSKTASVTITQPASALAITMASHTNVACNGGTGTATANAATGGTIPYTYLWSGGGGTNLVSAALTAGSYTITATDNHNCTATASVTITQPATALGITIASQTNVNCHGGTGSATANAAIGGTIPYTYLWSGGEGTNLASAALTAGSYTISATDNHGCTATVSVDITQPTALGITIASQTNVACNGGTGSATANAATGGTIPYTYLWSDASSQTALNATGLTAGIYTITAIDNNGCAATASVTITQPATALAITIASHTNVSCHGGTGTATASAATGGTTPYTYLWSGGGGTNLIASNLSAGSYTITATDNHGCSTTVSVSITQPTALGITIASHTNANCNGGTGTATSNSATGGTSPYTYSWSGGGGTNLTATGLTAGSYTITATDNHGCTKTVSVTITQPTILGVTIASNSNVACNGGIGNATANSATGGTVPYTYLWSDASSQTALNATGLSAGTYTITATDNHGCTATASVDITQPTSVGITIASQTNVACSGGNGSAIANAATGGTTPYTYLWSDASSQTALNATGLSAGTYTITTTDNHGCSASASVSITQPNTLSVSANTTANVTCNGLSNGGASSTVSGGTSPYTYSWSNSQTTPNISSLSAGTYTLNVTDNNGCTGSATVLVTQPPLLRVTTGPIINVSCFGANNGDINGTITGGTEFSFPCCYHVSWTGGLLGGIPISNVPPGTYTVTVTDFNGCTATASATVTQPPALVVLASANTNVLCNGGNTGSASSTISGGTIPYTYSWSNSQTTPTISSLSAGTYTLNVTDNNGCIGTASVSITQPASVLGITIASQTNISCNGGSGSATANAATGGTTPYTYLWSDASSQTALNATGLSAGTYTITTTDNHGCSASASVSITQPNTLSVSANTTANITCNGLSNGGASSTVSGGTIPYTYSWSNSQTTPTISSLSAGTYTLNVTDNNGCTGSATATITQPNTLSVSANTTANVTCSGLSNGGASSTVSGGTTPYTYIWSNSQTTPTISSLSAGTYTLNVTDNNGCTGSATAIITQPNTLSVSASTTANVSCNGLSNGGASSTITGGTSPYTYAWSNSQTTPTISSLSAGTYTLNVTDNNGCTGSATAIITQPNTLSVSASTTANVSCNGLSNGGASSTITGGTTPYTYSWSNSQTTPSISSLSAGTYTLNVTDNNGCTGSATAAITQPNTLSVSASTTANVSCNGLSNGGASSTITGGTTPYTYSWSNSQTTPSISSLSAGTYTLNVTDNNGCTGSATAAITQPNTLSVSASTTANVSCNGLGNGGASSTVNGGTIPYTYSWSGGGGSNSIASGLSAGTYTLNITDNNGCTGSATAVITQPQVIKVVTDSIPDNSAGSCDGSAWVNVSGGTAPYTYSWTGGNTTDSISNECKGTYCCKVTDAHGCIENVCITITSTLGIPNVSNNEGQIKVYPNPNNGQFTMQIVNGKMSVRYEIDVYNVLGEKVYSQFTSNNSADMINMNNQPSGVYSYRVLGENGSLIGEGKLIIQK